VNVRGGVNVRLPQLPLFIAYCSVLRKLQNETAFSFI